MKAKTRNFLRGAGSLIDLAPARDLRQLVPRMSAAERMSGHFARVGESMRRACGTFENDNVQTSRNKKQAA